MGEEEGDEEQWRREEGDKEQWRREEGECRIEKRRRVCGEGRIGR